MVQTRAERKRRQILDGATQAFLDHGYTGATTDVIARTAGVSKQTLYAYYPAKSQLLTDVMYELVDRFPRERDGSIADIADISDLRRATRTLVDTVADAITQPAYLGMIRIVVAESADHPEVAATFRTELAGPMLDRVGALVDSGRRAGVLREDAGDTQMLVRMLVGPLISGAILDGLLVDEDPTLPNETQRRDLVDRWLRAAGTPC